LGFNVVQSSEKKMGVDAVPNLKLKPIPINRDNGFSEGPEKNRPDYERASMSYP
jgi:hypothetical protein